MVRAITGAKVAAPWRWHPASGQSACDRGLAGDSLGLQLRQRVGPAGDAVEPSGDQHGSQLPAARQCRLEAWPPLAFAARPVGVLG